MGKQKHSKVKNFLNTSRKTKIHAIPKAWDKWISIVWKTYGKKQTFQNYEVPKYFTWSRNQYNSQTTRWVNSHITELVWENRDNSQVLFYLTDLLLTGTHAITNAWECANCYSTKISCGKTYHSQAVRFWDFFLYMDLERFFLWGNQPLSQISHKQNL